MSGAVLYGLGVGPGDPELLTLRARRVLGEVPVVAAIASPGRPSRALACARAHLPAGVEPRVFEVPMGERGAAEAAYRVMAEALGAELDAGRAVAVLCEGDPLFYGSFIYLQRRLAPRHPVRVVPGISAPAAAGAALGRPLACQDQTLAVLPASAGEARLRGALETFDTVVILKAGRARQAIARLIRACGRAAEASYCEELGGVGERLVRDLDHLPPGPGPYFSLFLVARGCP